MDAQASEPLLLYSDEDLERIEAEGWSPSGEILVKANRADWTTLLGFVPADGGELRVVKTLLYNRPLVRLSLDGKWIAYDVPSKSHAPSRDVYLLAADGSREALVSGHRANDYVVAFTAESEAILFASNRTGSYGLWAAKIRRLLAFRVLGKQEIWVLPVEGGDAVKVYESPEGSSPVNPAWTPEGDALVAIQRSPQSPQYQGIHRIPIDGSPAMKVKQLSDHMSDLSLHPDGKTIVYHDGRRDVRIWKMENYWSPESESKASEKK